MNWNIGSQYINGDYKGNFSDTKEFRVNFVYDNSNRLTEVERFSTKYFDMSGIFTYDSDGNFLNLTRSYNGDSFGYEYYTGTNRLKKVTGESDQFTYDYNGNLKNDYFNNNTDIKYDHRNLITEITRINELEDPPATYTTTYKYDEAGNRINKKVVKDDGSTMEIIVNEYYIRDVSGKEIGIYQNDTLKFWNVWGLANEGRTTADGIRYYYIKDHLGSIRAVLNDNNELVEAIDYDPWGHIAKYWTSTPSKYKFTGKERDNETGYDYFGARYYESRIGNWTSTDPLFEKHIQWSPYNYVLRNPMIFIDPQGNQIIFSQNEELRNAQLQDLKSFLQPEYSKFITTIQDEYGNYILDVNLLETAIDCLNTDFASAEYGEIRFLANSSLATTILYYYENGIIQANITGESGVAYTNLDSKVVGLTIVSGTIKNDETPQYYSISGNNEVYILYSQSNEQRVITLAHELRLHVYNYSKSVKWSHKPYSIEFELHKQYIEEQASRNYKLNNN